MEPTLTLDIFRNDAFSVTSLQRTVDNTPFIPTMLGDMAIFDSKPIMTREVLLYEKDGNVRLIPVTEIGSPDVMQIRDVGRMRALSTVRLAKMDSVRAGELLSVADTAIPETIRLRNAITLVAERTAALKQDMAATKELHRLGAIQGKLLDADGTTVIYDYFAQYGISTPATISVNFSTTAEADLMMFFQENVYRPMALSLQNRATPGGFRIAALVGDTFWGRLMRHPGFRNIYIYMQQAKELARAANPLVQPNAWETVDFAGVTWINYRGSTAGDIAIPTNDAIFFPVGATDVFQVYWGPGETLKDVGQKGKPECLYIQPDVRTEMPSFVDIFLRAYPLYACIYPKCLIRMTTTG
jgi:hypothetical protein